MHMALRAPSHCHLTMLTYNGDNALDEIHAQWKRMGHLSESIREGHMKGSTGHILQNILVIGKGASFASCQFIYDALRFDKDGSVALRQNIPDREMVSPHGRSVRFLSRLDPVALHRALSDWNPEQTLIVSTVLNGDEAPLSPDVIEG